MNEIRRKLLAIIFEQWLIALVLSALLSVVLSKVIPSLSFWWLFVGNIIGGTGVAIYFYIKEYIKIKRIINQIDNIAEKLKEEMLKKDEKEETKI